MLLVYNCLPNDSIRKSKLDKIKNICFLLFQKWKVHSVILELGLTHHPPPEYLILKWIFSPLSILFLLLLLLILLFSYYYSLSFLFTTSSPSLLISSLLIPSSCLFLTFSNLYNFQLDVCVFSLFSSSSSSLSYFSRSL